MDAFQATLQEAIDADLLMHVIDASNPHFVEQIEQVQRVLVEIGADKIPQLLVFNKIDALDADRQPLLLEDFFEIDGVQTPRIFVSAKALQGLELLRKKISATLAASRADDSEDPSHAPARTGAES